jgi:hypothetical protein
VPSKLAQRCSAPLVRRPARLASPWRRGGRSPAAENTLSPWRPTVHLSDGLNFLLLFFDFEAESWHTYILAYS